MAKMMGKNRDTHFIYPLRIYKYHAKYWHPIRYGYKYNGVLEVPCFIGTNKYSFVCYGYEYNGVLEVPLLHW